MKLPNTSNEIRDMFTCFNPLYTTIIIVSGDSDNIPYSSKKHVQQLSIKYIIFVSTSENDHPHIANNKILRDIK
jgi:hypothetical protein